MAQQIVTVPGAVTVSDLGIGSPPQNTGAVVGTENIWHDSDDATYAEVVTFEHPDVSYSMTAIGLLGQVPAISQNAELATVVARVRYQSLDPDMGPPMVTVVRPGASPDRQYIYTAMPSGPGAPSPTWIDIPLSQPDLSRVADFLTAIKNGEEVHLRIGAPWLYTYSFRYPRTRIFEAYLIVTGPGEAPPCRQIRRGDVYDPGGARQFPPSKMQQTSPRHVGAY